MTQSPQESAEVRAREVLAAELTAQGFDVIAADVLNDTYETYAVPRNIAIRAMLAFAHQSPSRAAGEGFLDAVREFGPNGEFVVVQVWPNGDWSVFDPASENAPKAATTPQAVPANAELSAACLCEVAFGQNPECPEHGIGTAWREEHPEADMRDDPTHDKPATPAELPAPKQPSGYRHTRIGEGGIRITSFSRDGEVDPDYPDETIEPLYAVATPHPVTGNDELAGREDVPAAVYEAAVKGRQDFRQAYRELLPIQRAAQALSDHWRTPGAKVDSDEFFGLINAIDVAVTGGGPSTPEMRARVAARRATPAELPALPPREEIVDLIRRIKLKVAISGSPYIVDGNAEYTADKILSLFAALHPPAGAA